MLCLSCSRSRDRAEILLGRTDTILKALSAPVRSFYGGLVGHRLLFVHAHPDDESLWTGGTIARHVAAGGDADLIVCTWAPGTSRHSEVVAAARILGLPRPPIALGYADDRIPASAPGAPRFCDVRLDTQVREMVEIIRRLRPDALVTYDPIGVYGHQDHIHAHRLADAAARAAAVPNIYRRLGDPWQIKSIYEVTTAAWMVDILWEHVFDDMAVDRLQATPDLDIDVRVDIESPAIVDRKEAAIQAHHTELDRSRAMKALMSLPTDIRRTLLATECYRHRDLVPGGVDLL